MKRNAKICIKIEYLHTRRLQESNDFEFHHFIMIRVRFESNILSEEKRIKMIIKVKCTF